MYLNLPNNVLQADNNWIYIHLDCISFSALDYQWGFRNVFAVMSREAIEASENLKDISPPLGKAMKGNWFFIFIGVQASPGICSGQTAHPTKHPLVQGTCLHPLSEEHTSCHWQRRLWNFQWLCLHTNLRIWSAMANYFRHEWMTRSIYSRQNIPAADMKECKRLSIMF